MLNVNKSKGTFIIFIYHNNCTNHSDHKVEDDALLTALSSIQFGCNLLSFLFAMIAFFVVKYYTIAGRRMNHLLLLLTVMEIQYNGASVINHLIDLIPVKHVTPNIYLRVTFSLLSHQHSILTRNWWTAVIALARYLVVCRPFGKCHLGIINSNVYFAVILFVGLFYCIIFTFWFRIFAFICQDSESFYLYIWDLHDPSASLRVADSLIVLIKSLFPFFIVLILSVLTYRLVKKPSLLQKASVKRNIRTSCTLLLICLLFTICQLPYALTIIFCFLEKDKILHVYNTVRRVSLILVAVNSLGNVAIYFIRSKDFRMALSNIRQCRCNFVQLRKVTRRQKILSSWNSYSMSKEKSNEFSMDLEEDL